MNKATEIVVSAGVGAVASVLLEAVIAEAKKVLAFKYVSKELATTMEDLRPIIQKIESMNTGENELKNLKFTIERADKLVKECLKVKWWDPVTKAQFTRRIATINLEMLNFCQVQLPLTILSKQMESRVEKEEFKGQIESIIEKLKLLSIPKPRRVFKDRCSAPMVDNDKFIVGLGWPLMEVKKKLLDDSVVSLVVSAPPGCGKTTLVTKLCHDKDIKEKFKHIFFHVVSSTPNFRVIVQNLLQHNGYEPCTFDDDSQATVALSNLMEELKEDGPILLVLDDVWQKAELFLDKFRNYKILVTSRFAFPSLCFTYPLKPLKDEDARSLLIRWASPPHHPSEDLLRKILKRCDGFPLVIEVVGVSLKGIPLHLWNGQVDSWSNNKTLIGHPDVLQRLQPSIDALESHLKECFLDMSSFLEDQKIHASVIIDIWVELYGNGSSSSSEYMKYLHDLASQNLLKLIHLGRNVLEDGFYNELLVTQHDILRELAIYQTKSEEKHETKRERLNLEIRDDGFPNWCSDLTHIDARVLSISTDDLFSSNWVEMDCPNVEALILNLSSSNYELPNFISKMKKLKVVVIINHGAAPARLTNLSCLSSLPNLKRIRLEKVSFTLLEILRLQLSRLRKLSLVMCSFGNDIQETDVFKALPSLQEIDINYCYDLEKISWVSKVVSLKTLSITDCYKLSSLPQAIGNLSKLEVLRLCSCINLSELPETMERLEELRFLDISECLELKKLPLGIGKLQKLKKISMSKCPGCVLPDSVRYLKDLEVKCDEETGFLWERLKLKMSTLRVLEEEVEHNLNKLHCLFLA